MQHPLLHGLVPDRGWLGQVLSVGLFLLLALHAFGFVLLSEQEAPPGGRARWVALLLVPLVGPLVFLWRWFGGRDQGL